MTSSSREKPSRVHFNSGTLGETEPVPISRVAMNGFDPDPEAPNSRVHFNLGPAEGAHTRRPKQEVGGAVLGVIELAEMKAHRERLSRVLVPGNCRLAYNSETGSVTAAMNDETVDITDMLTAGKSLVRHRSDGNIAYSIEKGVAASAIDGQPPRLVVALPDGKGITSLGLNELLTLPDPETGKYWEIPLPKINRLDP